MRLDMTKFSPRVDSNFDSPLNYDIDKQCGVEDSVSPRRCEHYCTRIRGHHGPHVSYNFYSESMNCNPWIGGRDPDECF